MPKLTALARVALRRSDLIDRQSENCGCGSPMNVFSAEKCFGQTRIAGQVRQDPQFHLRIVGRHEPASLVLE